MTKMILFKGLPASGKTTKSLELIKTTGNTIRLNKDSLRKMLHGDLFTRKNEELTRESSRILARHFLTKGVNVIIDDTNLNPKTMQSWKDLASEINAKTEIIDITDIPVELCVMRDNARAEYVGGTVIKNMALQYGLQPAPSPLKGYVICDIDGTIADCEHRRHYVKQTPKDWKGFFAHMGEDTLIQSTAHLLIDYYNKMHTIIFVSARPEDYKEQTLNWLEKHNMTFAWTLIMRPKGDTRPDTEVKQDIYDKYLKKYPIEVVIDDRPVVIEMWKSHGLKVIDVGNGEDF